MASTVTKKNSGKNPSLPASDVRSYDNYEDCDTNSGGHASIFASVNAFKGPKVAEYCRQNEIFHLVTNIMDMSVLIEVTEVNKKGRYEAKPNCSIGRERYQTELDPIWGSGSILKVDEESGKIVVFTANHVVFDDIEAKSANCWLHFNDKDGNEPAKKVLLKGEHILQNNLDKDICLFQCELRLDKMNNDKKLTIKMIKENLEAINNLKTKLSLTKFNRDEQYILISHPHGCQTYISMGTIMETEESDMDETEEDSNDEAEEIDYYAYKATNCSGTSGGYLFIVGESDHFIHSGFNNQDRTGNSSGRFFFSDFGI